MRLGTDNRGPEPRHDGGTLEPPWMTLADLGVIVAGVALVMTIPARAMGWPFYLPPPSLLYLLVIGGLRLTVGCGMVLTLVVLSRRARYGGPVRNAEWLALVFGSLCLLEVVPNLDEVVNAHYAAVGSNSLNFGAARWLFCMPAAAGVALVGAGLVLLRRRARDGSRVASALTVVGLVGGFSLWFWGPCEVARLELPWLLVPGPRGGPLSWGWRAPVVFALRDVVANAPTAFTWGLPAAVTLRTWCADRHRVPERARVWTELAAFAVALVAALLLTVVGPQAAFDILRRLSFVAFVGLVSWWIAGRLGIGRSPTPDILNFPANRTRP